MCYFLTSKCALWSERTGKSGRKGGKGRGKEGGEKRWKLKRPLHCKFCLMVLDMGDNEFQYCCFVWSSILELRILWFHTASSKDLVQKRPIATATVGNVCQLDMFLPTWMDPDDMNADVTRKGVKVEKLSTLLIKCIAVYMDLPTSLDTELYTVCDLDIDLLTLTHWVTVTVHCGFGH